jgi:hypothetical protein
MGSKLPGAGRAYAVGCLLKTAVLRRKRLVCRGTGLTAEVMQADFFQYRMRVLPTCPTSRRQADESWALISNPLHLNFMPLILIVCIE